MFIIYDTFVSCLNKNIIVYNLLYYLYIIILIIKNHLIIFEYLLT